MADIKSINFLENTTPASTRNIFVGNESDGEWERLTVEEFFTNFNIVSGTYTPTMVNVLNATTLSASDASFLRVGNEVSVKMYVLLFPSTGVQIKIRASLPFSSSFSSLGHLTGSFSGTGMDLSGITPRLNADTVNNDAIIEFTSNSDAVANLYVTFQYTVI